MTRTQLGEEERGASSSPPPAASTSRPMDTQIPHAPHPAAEFLARPDFYSILHMNLVSVCLIIVFYSLKEKIYLCLLDLK